MATSSLTVTRGRGENMHLCKATSEATGIAGIAEMVESYGANWGATAAAVSSATNTTDNNNIQDLEVDQQNCECCGLSEECTAAYVERTRAVSCGRFVCGLCVEAVKEEMKRMGEGTDMEAALQRHMSMCVQFQRFDPVTHLASALRQILRRSVQASRSPKSTAKLRTPSWHRAGLSRSESCVDLRATSAAVVVLPSSSDSKN